MIWDLVMVTIAAQVLTAPLVAWHFHRLPLLFLFANLPVVPLSSLTLLLGILICLLCWSPILAEPLGRSTTFLIHVMNGQVMGMDAVPHASLTELHPGRIQILIIYVMILLLRSSCQNTCLLTISLCWMGMVACLMLGSQEASRHERQRVLVIFQTRRQSLCALVEGTDMLVLADPAENRDSVSGASTRRSLFTDAAHLPW
jgi:competence protein ComEC